MRRKLRHVLEELDPADLRSNIGESLAGELIWTGAYDRRNHAPIGDTSFGTRYSPIQIVKLLHEVAKRPHLPALDVVRLHLTPSGNLMKAGSARTLHPRELSPSARQFGTLGASLPAWYPHPKQAPALSRKGSDSIRELVRGLQRIQRELSADPLVPPAPAQHAALDGAAESG